MAEVMPRHLVGHVMVGNMLCVMSGVLIMGIISINEILATSELWPGITGELFHKEVCILVKTVSGALWG